MGIIKLIWEFIKSSPQIIGLLNELLKLIRSLAGNEGETKDQLKQVKIKIRDLHNPKL